ncbi:MAG: hypothetical protein IIT55_10255, partial [Bacteroidaceae bacterium]|nr:hypothetical protein [Bacteroidaceae bacterium]
YKDKPVAIVEGEKSCLIASVTNPKFLWIACGGNGLNPPTPPRGREAIRMASLHTPRFTLHASRFTFFLSPRGN